MEHKRGILALETGEYFEGQSLGKEGLVAGELVFNTGMTGYQEILTDPSYCQQIIQFTSSHIGNVGFNAQDYESDQVYATGIVVQEASNHTSNWRAEGSFNVFLLKHNVVGIQGVDTRYITRILRDKGALKAAIMSGVDICPDKAIEAARQFSGLESLDLTAHVSTKAPYILESLMSSKQPYTVVVVDFGVKRSILARLRSLDCRLIVVPANTSYDSILALKPDGILFSNGPGDPAACIGIQENITQLLKSGIPMLGICLGYQLLAICLGARTYKMPFGHHGVNHPVQDVKTQKVYITSQNHGFAVQQSNLPETVKVTHRSLFDGSLQGIAHCTLPIIGFQGHPEAGPGPCDVYFMFQQFIELMQTYKEAVQPTTASVTMEEIAIA